MRLFYAKRRVYTIRGKFLLLFAVLFILCMLILFIYNTCYSSTIRERARVRANYVAINAINHAVEATLGQTGFSYNDFINMERKTDNSVSSITVNTVKGNRFKSELTQIVLDTVSAYGREEIYMAPFSMYGYTNVPFGIRIPVLVIPIEILSADFVNTMESHGINQTLYQCSIRIKISVKMLLPIGSESFDVVNTVPLAQTVIVGDIPDTYTNVEGVTESGSDTILNLAP